MSMFWSRADSGRFARRYWCWNDPPIIVSGDMAGRRIKIVSLGNWAPDAQARICRALPLLHPDPAHLSGKATAKMDISGLRCASLMWTVSRILGLVEREDIGCLRATFGAQALQSYRHKNLHGLVGIHNNDAATRLEREVPLGTPVQAPAGKVTHRDVTILDCNALYPYVMGAYPYPRRLERVVTSIDVERLREASQVALIIARVWLRPSPRMWCVMRDGRALYEQAPPSAVLAGQDLCAALDSDLVAHCELAALYEPAGLFTAWSEWALGMRERYRDSKSQVDREIVKATVNALWGRFAARQEYWQPYAAVQAPTPFGVFYHTAARQPAPILCRAIAGQVERLVERCETDESFAAISAMVAVNARCHMDRLCAVAGPGNVLYRVADAIHVNAAGLHALGGAGFIHQRTPGLLKVVRQVQQITYHGRNVFVADGEITRAGVSGGAVMAADGRLVWPEVDRCSQIVMHGASGRVRVRYRSAEPI